jgi:ClpP class serine protease
MQSNNFHLTDLFWLVIFVLSMKPVLDQYMLNSYRIKLMRGLEKKRGSRMIALVHRQESVNLLGMPVIQYINIEDAQSVLNAIRLTDDDVPIDILLHTPSDLSMPAEQIARALKRHKAKVTVFVPHYAMSGGTAIALASDQLIMSENAVLGAIEPVIKGYPVSSYLHVLKTKAVAKIADETWIYADLAAKELAQIKAFVLELLPGKVKAEEEEKLSVALTSGRWTHDYPISVNELRDLGLEINTEIPLEIYQVMNLYPQARGARPSVEFVPVPYSQPKAGN